MPQQKRSGKYFGLGAVLLAIGAVATFEGVSLVTYDDPVGVPTVCAGETDKDVVMREQFTRDECMALLGASLLQHAQDISLCVFHPVKPHEAAAIISWTYNVGAAAACKSTLIRKLNAGEPPAVWCAELHKWKYAGGRVMNGLVKRRQKEFNMCTTGAWDA